MFLFAFILIKIYNIAMNKKIKSACAVVSVIAALSAALSTGCKPDGVEIKLRSPYFFSMGTDAFCNLPKDVTESRVEDCNDLLNEIEGLLLELDYSLNTTNSNSYVYKFNAAGAGSIVELDKAAYEVFSLAKSMYELTDGYYNPSVYYSVQAYGFGGAPSHPTTADELPSDEIIEKYKALSCFGEVRLFEEEGKYYAAKPEVSVQIDGVEYAMKVDMGGIGKGYAVDLVNELLEEYDMEYGYFVFGGSSIAFKKFKGNDAGDYTLGLSNPRGSGNVLSTSVQNLCTSTSGDNVQYYMIDDVRYSHIMDPFTCKPIQTGVMSALIVGGSAAENDALSTSIMAMGKERAVEFINEKLSERKVVFLYDSGEGYQIVTNLAEGNYKLLSEDYTVISEVKDGKIVLGN